MKSATPTFCSPASLSAKNKLVVDISQRHYCSRNLKLHQKWKHPDNRTSPAFMADNSSNTDETENVTNAAPQNAKSQVSSPSRFDDEAIDPSGTDVDSSTSTQRTLSQSSPKQRYSLRTRLREEIEAPFRKARMFVYAASTASAGVGAFIATLRIIAALTGVSGVQPLNETVSLILYES